MALDDLWNRFRFFSTQSKRDYDNTFDHPKADYTCEDYMKLYLRGDICQTIVKAIPEKCWAGCKPYVRETMNYKVETPFEKAWEELTESQPIIAELARIDILSGIGRFGGLFLGFDDNKKMYEPVSRGATLLFTRPLSEKDLKISRVDQNPKSPRFGMPVSYSGSWLDEKLGRKTYEVHWTRIFHVADNRIESNVFGRPRIEPVLNRVLDIAKILGVSAETFWLGAFGGLAFEADADTQIENPEELEGEIEKYVAGLQRYLKLQGIKTKTLDTNIADPSRHIEVQLQMISAQTGIPVSVLIGSARGELASGKDFALLSDKVEERRTGYIDPYLLKPFIQHLVELKSMPAPQHIYISWFTATQTLRKEQLDGARVFTDACRMYIESGAYNLISPPHFLEDVLKVDAGKVELYNPATADTLRKYAQDAKKREGAEIDDSSFKDITPEEKKISG